MQSVAFLFSGLAAGIFSGALGIGGAIVATPLIRFAGLSPYLAIGTTVPAILPGALTGAWAYGRANLVDTRAAVTIGAAGAIFSFLGARATRAFDGHVLMLLTAGVLFLLAVRVPAKRNVNKDLLQRTVQARPRQNAPALVLLGASAGFFSGLLGIGGGSVIVPALIRIFDFPIKMALGTSLSVIAVMAAPSIVGHTQAGNIDWKVALLLAAGIIPGAKIGSALAIRSSDKALRVTVAVALCTLAAVYAGNELAALSSRP